MAIGILKVVTVVLIAQVVGIVDRVCIEPAVLVIDIGVRSIGTIECCEDMTDGAGGEGAVPVLISAGNAQCTGTGIDQVCHVTAVALLVSPDA